ncbi:MAG: DNA repair protein RecN [Acutalibacteraceae bacterium]|jgi:DNA repair protein RecN (Recombination protein N)
MLQHIHIENMAVIEAADLDLEKGLNVLTGETGAGKSIVIDALNMVLGERSSRDLVRTGCDKAEVTALFGDLSDGARRALEEMGYDLPDGQAVIRRRITADGKSACYLNGAPITAAMLREVGRRLVNIHGQHENQALLSEDRQRDYLDVMGQTDALKATYLEAYHRYGEIARRLRRLRINEQEKAQRIDTLRFRVEEIERFSPQPGEEGELTARRDQIRHAEKIAGALRRAAVSLDGDEETPGAVALLQQAAGALEEIADVLPDAKTLADGLRAAQYDAEAAAEEVIARQDRALFPEEEQEQVEARLSGLRRLLNKYGPTEEQLFAALDEAKRELQDLDDRDQTIADNERLLEQAERDTVAAAAALTEARRRTADRFSAQVEEQLRFLDMPGTVLQVAMEPTTLTATGGDKVTFLLSANAGEEPRPLSRAASGGELSRIMLAIKSVMAGADDIDTLIFDEIDTGISWQAARKVGVKLRQTAQRRQVLCVTHLAQIAAAAERQLVVQKQVRDGRTFTAVTAVDGEQRLRELSRIISGEVTPSGMAAAGDLLERAAREEKA